MTIRNIRQVIEPKIVIEGAGKNSGVYQVRDVMNKRFVNRIDILESTDVKPYKYDKAKIIKTDLVLKNNS